jgi:hypothetical protein
MVRSHAKSLTTGSTGEHREDRTEKSARLHYKKQGSAEALPMPLCSSSQQRKSKLLS